MTLQPIKAKNLSTFKGIDHGFFTKHGGTSKGIYGSLNIALNVQDKKESVLKNRQLICNYFLADENNLDYYVQLSQNHTDDVLVITNEQEYFNTYSKKPFVGDAIVCNVKKFILTMATADCGNVLLYDDDKKIIGGIHAGWIGAKGKIIENTIKKMQELGSQPKNIVCAMGASIHQPSYEVDQEFYQSFLDDNIEYDKYFINSNNEKHKMFDVPHFIFDKLTNLGITNIEKSFADSYLDENFYSFRENTVNGNSGITGRHASCIMLK